MLTCASLKIREVAESASTGAVPFPLTDIVAGLPAALCETVRVADLSPLAVGAKVTVIGWLWFAGTVVVVGEIAKALSLEVMALMVRDVAWLLVSVKI